MHKEWIYPGTWFWRSARRPVSASKGPATRNDFVNDIVNDARADAIFATLKAIVDDEKSTISSTISLRVAWLLEGRSMKAISGGKKGSRGRRYRPV